MLKKWLKAQIDSLISFPSRVLQAGVNVFTYLGDLQCAVITNWFIMSTLILITNSIQSFFPSMYPQPDGDGMCIIFWVPAWFLLLKCLEIGVLEEGFFRYLIMDAVCEQWCKMPKWVSLTISSLLFGAAHLMNPGGWWLRLPQAVGTAGAGFLFGYLYRKRGLHFAILTHALYDFAIFWCVVNGIIR